MDIAAIAERYAELDAKLMKKSIAALEKERKGLKDTHNAVAAAAAVDRLRSLLLDIAVKPLASDRKALEDAGVPVKVVKQNTFRKCLEGYTVVSDLRGFEPDWYSNGMVLEKGGKTFYACAADFKDFAGEFYGDNSSPVEKFTREFSRTVAISRLASEKGLSLPIVEAFACFHAEGFTGYIVFEGKASTKTWSEHIEQHIKGNMYSPKNRAIVGELTAKVAPAAKAKMDKLHDAGVIFAFRGYNWLDTSGIVIDFDRDGTPTDVFPLNYTCSVMVKDVVKDSILKDYEILDRLQKDHNLESEKRLLVSEIIAANLVKEGLISVREAKTRT